MSGVVPYSVLAEDPTTEALIYWIDDRDEARGSEQTIRFGADDADLDREVRDADPRAVPELEGTYRYVAAIDGLVPNTRYHAEIREGRDVLETCQWVTLPASLDERPVRVVVHSDWHTDREGSPYMNDPRDVDVIWAEEPDISLFAGDYLTFAANRNEANAAEWIGIFREYYGRYDEQELVHTLAVPGNHEVGNHQWNGTKAERVAPDAGYYQFFYGHPRLLEPVGENYGQITVGDFLQILALDTHSAYPEDVGEWIGAHLDEEVTLCLPFQHEGFVQLGDRDANALRDAVRRAWFRTLYEAPNVYFWQHGHVHTEGRTKPLQVVDERPAGDAFFELDDGYVVSAPTPAHGLSGFGEGWRDDRPRSDEWYVERVQPAKSFTLVTLSSTSIDLEVIDDEGEVLDSQTYRPDPASIAEVSSDGRWTLSSRGRWSTSASSPD